MTLGTDRDRLILLLVAWLALEVVVIIARAMLLPVEALERLFPCM